MTNTSQQIGASIGTALLNTIAAAAAATYLATHARTGDVVATATVHGYAAASAWATGIFVLAAVLAGLLINVHPGQSVADPATASGAGASDDQPLTTEAAEPRGAVG
jgi:hypothetical protein